MSEEIQSPGASFGTVADVIKLLEPLSPADREHVLRTITTWFKIHSGSSIEHTEARPQSVPAVGKLAEDEKFSNRQVLSVKDFLFEKNPLTESERMACLAYYCTHFMDTPHFKTADLTRLNTEAAQRTFSNPTVASSNAIRDGYFVSAPKAGFKQLSAMGERFVHSLPDRDAAEQIKQRMGMRRGKRKNGRGRSGETPSENT